jgi:hypothetical protein
MPFSEGFDARKILVSVSDRFSVGCRVSVKRKARPVPFARRSLAGDRNVRTYYGRSDGRGLPTVLVAADGRLWELPPLRHHRCADPGHGWGEEVQGLNTAWTLLRHVLDDQDEQLAGVLCHEYRAQVISRLDGSSWSLTSEQVLRWVVGALLVYAWPITVVGGLQGKGGDHEPLR